jgi:heptosyltransferase I
VKVLIVKVSSLGDIIHTLPAVTDAYKAKRGLRFDWVVEEAFSEIPGWHPAVDRVIPVALRRWRRQGLKAWRSGEISQFRQNLTKEYYDLVIDAQGLIKSALISRMARGLTVGLSNHTIREPLATLFYNVVYTVPWQQHAVERVRELFSRTFNYSVDHRYCDYGIDTARFNADVTAPPDKNLIFFHGTTWSSKHWPEQYWQQLAKMAVAAGYQIRLPWGSEEELARARRIQSGLSGITVLERMSLKDLGRELCNTSGVVAVDTGLAHLAAALAVPVVSLHGASSPELTGTYAKRQLHLKSALPCSPCLKRVCEYQGEVSHEFHGEERFKVWPACYGDMSPGRVWDELRYLMRGGKGSLDGYFHG